MTSASSLPCLIELILLQRNAWASSGELSPAPVKNRVAGSLWWLTPEESQEVCWSCRKWRSAEDFSSEKGAGRPVAWFPSFDLGFPTETKLSFGVLLAELSLEQSLHVTGDPSRQTALPGSRAMLNQSCSAQSCWCSRFAVPPCVLPVPRWRQPAGGSTLKSRLTLQLISEFPVPVLCPRRVCRAQRLPSAGKLIQHQPFKQKKAENRPLMYSNVSVYIWS